MTTRTNLLLCTILAGAVTLDTLSAREPLKLVRLEDDLAAGTPGNDFFNFQKAIINNAGELGYLASLKPGGGVSLANNDGIWTDDANLLNGESLVSRENSTAPGSGAAVFTNLVNASTFQINDQGVFAFRAKLKGPGISNPNDTGIWSRVGGPSTLTLVAREGDPAPGTDGVFGTLGLPAQADSASGDLYFKATLTGGTVTNSSNSAIYGYLGGVLTLIHREGDVTPVLPIGASGPATTGSYGQFLGEVSVSESGILLFAASLGGGVPSSANTGLFIRSAGTTSLNYQEGLPLPDATGTPTAAVISGFTTYAINDSSEVIFRANLQINVGGVGPTNNTAVVTDAGGTLRSLGREGDVSPEGGNTFSIFRNIFIGNSSAVSFSAILSGNTDAIYSAAAGGGAVNLAKEGIPAAGTDSDYNILNRPAMNHEGQILYSSTLVVMNTTVTSNNAGLWRTTGPATPPTADELISRKGDFEDDICGDILAYRLNAPTQLAGGVSGIGRAINDSDNLVVALTTTTSGSGNANGVYVLGEHPPIFCEPPSNEVRNIPAGTGPIVVSWTPPVVTDDVDPLPVVVSTHSPGDSFFPGVTVVTYTATDFSGNVSTYRFRVIVTEIRDLNKVVVPDLLVRRDDPAVAGETFRTFSTVCLNGNDAVAIRATTNSGLVGVWSNEGGPLGVVALTGDPAPGMTTLNSFQDIRITAGGRTAFNSKRTPSTPTTDIAAFIQNPAVTNSLVAAEGDVAPGSPGGTYRQVFAQAVSQGPAANFSYYPSLLQQGVGGVTVNNDTGVWFFDADAATGSVRMVTEGDPVPGLAGVNYGTVSARVVTGGDDGAYLYNTLLSGAGVNTGNNDAIWASTIASTTPELLIREGDEAAGPISGVDASSQWKKAFSTQAKRDRRDTGRYNRFLGEAISPNGRNIAFRARLKLDGHVRAGTNVGVWSISDNRDSFLVAREGHQAPGMREGVCFDRFDNLAVDDDGNVWFRAWLRHDVALGIDSSNDSGIWSNSGGFLRWIYHEGQLAPNTDGALVLRIDGFSYHKGGFTAVLALAVGTGDALSPNNLLLTSSDSDGLTALGEANLREGDQFEDGPGIFRTFNFFDIDSPFNAAGGSGGYCNPVDGSIDRVVLKTSFGGNGNAVLARDLSDVGP